MTGPATTVARTRISASERARRNATMAARKASGATYLEVAAEFGVAVSTAKQAIADHRAAGGVVLPADPLGVRAEDALRTALDTYGWAEEVLRALAAEADNSSARVGAIRQAVLVAEKRIELLTTAGVIPSADALLIARLQEQQRRFAAVVLDVLGRYGVDLREVYELMSYARPVDGGERCTTRLAGARS